MKPHAGWLLVVLGAIGCDKASTPPAPSAVAATPSAEPSPSTRPQASAASSAAPTVEAPPPKKLHLVAKANGELSLAPLGESTWIHTASGVFARVQGDTLVSDTAMRSGLSGESPFAISGRAVQRVSGRFPDSAWLVRRMWQRYEYWDTLYRWEKGSWTLHRGEGAVMTRTLQPAVPFADGRLVFLTHAPPTKGPCEFAFSVVDGPPFEVAPFDRSVQEVYAGEKVQCGLDAIGGSLRGLPSGHLFLLGRGVMEHWTAEGGQGAFVKLPGKGGAGEIAVFAPDDIYVGGALRGKDGKYRPYLAHFDGKAFTELEAPGDEPVSGLAPGPDGALWLTESRYSRDDDADAPSGGAVYERPKGGAWSRVELPGVAQQGVTGVETDGRDVYVLAFSRKDAAEPWRHLGWVYRTRPVTEVFDFVPLVEPEKRIRTSLRPADATCEKVYVLLYTLSTDAPADFDFPATRKAVRGHPEFSDAKFVETDDGVQRYLGALVPSLEEGQKLVAVVKRGVPQSKPIALCGTPPPVRRELKMKL